ncbi:hypothetical protein A3Q56_05330, partial [Intoshia linei]
MNYIRDHELEDSKTERIVQSSYYVVIDRVRNKVFILSFFKIEDNYEILKYDTFKTMITKRINSDVFIYKIGNKMGKYKTVVVANVNEELKVYETEKSIINANNFKKLFHDDKKFILYYRNGLFYFDNEMVFFEYMFIRIEAVAWSFEHKKIIYVKDKKILISLNVESGRILKLAININNLILYDREIVVLITGNLNVRVLSKSQLFKITKFPNLEVSLQNKDT